MVAITLLDVDNDVAITDCDCDSCDINVNNDVIIYNRNYDDCNIAQC